MLSLLNAPDLHPETKKKRNQQAELHVIGYLNSVLFRCQNDKYQFKYQYKTLQRKILKINSMNVKTD